MYSKLLKDTDVKIAAVVGFPVGTMDTESKSFWSKKSYENGASEIDMVINIGMLLSGNSQYVEDEIRQIKKAIGDNVLKVIIEAYLSKWWTKRLACQLSLNAKADFVKTSTGFGTGGATYEDVKLMKKFSRR